MIMNKIIIIQIILIMIKMIINGFLTRNEDNWNHFDNYD